MLFPIEFYRKLIHYHNINTFWDYYFIWCLYSLKWSIEIMLHFSWHCQIYLFLFFNWIETIFLFNKQLPIPKISVLNLYADKNTCTTIKKTNYNNSLAKVNTHLMEFSIEQCDLNGFIVMLSSSNHSLP